MGSDRAVRGTASGCTRMWRGFLLSVLVGSWASGAAEPPGIVFEKHVIDSEFPAISAVALDVDGDGVLDVVAGGGPNGGPSRWSNRIHWYKGPDWKPQVVGLLDQKAVILHVERVNLSTRRAAAPAAGGAPVEVVVTDGALGEIWWYRFDRAQGTWSGRIIVAGYVGAHGTAAGDIDRDGYDDLLVPSQMGTPRNGIVWARNPGATTNGWTVFPLAERFTISGWQEYVRLADVNGDGRLDALHGSDGGDGWFGFWLQPADPTKGWDEHRLAGPMKKATNLDAADLDGDGTQDLVGSEGHGVGIWWFPAPTYEPKRVDETLRSTHSLATGDLNGDGTVDIVSCGYESRTAACFLNRGAGQFTRVVIDTNQCAYDARLADLDRDGDPDILLSGQTSGNLVWYENRAGRGAGQ